MSKQSGFVPIPFHITGKILMLIGLMILGAYAISYLTNWFQLSVIAFVFALAIIILALYLIYIVPREPNDSESGSS